MTTTVVCVKDGRVARVAGWLGTAKVDVTMNMIIDNENGLRPSVAYTNAVVYESTGEALAKW